MPRDNGSVRGPKREHWASRAGFIMATAGSAVGLGNIWRFPYLAGENGGGVFLIVYLIFVATIGLSVLLAELVIGRMAQKDPVGAFRSLGGGLWPLVGLMGVVAALVILSFYGVVAGWTVAFAGMMAGGVFNDAAAGPAAVFGGLVSDPVRPLIYAALFMALTVAVVIGGIKRGIERANLVLMPALFLLLVALVVRSLTLPGAIEGVAFFLEPDFSKLSAETVTAALAQTFFSLGVGIGVMITYGSYLGKEQPLISSAGAIIGLDTLAAVLAGFVVLPAVFAIGVDPASGPALAFLTLPSVFMQMPGGQLFGTLFFALLAIAALTSAVSLLEPAVSVLIDEYGVGRVPATAVLGCAAFVLGIPSSLSMGPWADVTLFGKGFLELMDFTATSVMLPVGGILIALFAGWVIGRRAIDELSGGHPAVSSVAVAWMAGAWLLIVRIVAPVAIAWVLVNGLIA